MLVVTAYTRVTKRAMRIASIKTIRYRSLGSRAQGPATCHLRGNVDKKRAAYVTSCPSPPTPVALRTSSRSTTFYRATFARSSIRVIRRIPFLNCAGARLFLFFILFYTASRI